jgi:hypothetical protein
MTGDAESDSVVAAVRSHLESRLARYGFTFNTGQVPADGETTAVLYEASPERFVGALPRLMPAWDEAGWRDVGCVDFWIYYHHHDGGLEVHIDWWPLERLSAFASTREVVESAISALSSGAPLGHRLEAIGVFLEDAFAEAAKPTGD